MKILDPESILPEPMLQAKDGYSANVLPGAAQL